MIASYQGVFPRVAQAAFVAPTRDRIVAGDTEAPGWVMVGMQDGALWLSRDHGESFARIASGLPTLFGLTSVAAYMPHQDLWYGVSKAGIVSFTRSFAAVLGPHGVQVNAVAPGIVAVGLAKRQWDADPAYRRRAQKAIPLGAMQPPESVADAVIFLCSRASDYMTGATVLVDGGCSLYPMD